MAPPWVGGVGVVGTDGDLELAQDAVGFFLAVADHAQGAYAFAVEAEALGEAGGHKNVQLGGHKLRR